MKTGIRRAGPSILDLAYRPKEAGLLRQLDKTKPWSRALVVRSAFPALEVADMVDLNNMNLVLTVDQEDKIEGVLAPESMRGLAAHILPSQFTSDKFSTVVSEIIKQSRNRKAGFDWFSSRGPDLYWCDRGQHMTTELPCTEDHS
jgi:hypothetical protein